MSALGGGLWAEMVMVLVVKIPQPIIELSLYLFGSSTPAYPGLNARDMYHLTKTYGQFMYIYAKMFWTRKANSICSSPRWLFIIWKYLDRDLWLLVGQLGRGDGDETVCWRIHYFLSPASQLQLTEWRHRGAATFNILSSLLSTRTWVLGVYSNKKSSTALRTKSTSKG